MSLRRSLLLASLLAGSLGSPAALAAKGVEVAVVGLHVDGLDDDAALDAAERVARGLDDTGRLQAVLPGAVRSRLAGRESLVVEGAFLGPGRQQLQEGRVLYERADFEGAIPALDGAVDSLENGLVGAADNRALIDALLLLGLANAGLGEFDPAREAFQRVVVLDPTRELDPVNYSPKIVALYDEVRQAVLALPKGRIVVVAPEGSHIYFDGVESLSPNVQLPPGAHYVLVVGDEGRRSFTRLDVLSGKKITYEAALQARSLAEPGRTEGERSRQVELLYRSLGNHVNTSLVLLGGETADREVAVQLYEPHTGNFSKLVSASGGGDPVAAVTDLLPTLGNYVTDQGTLRTDRVSHQVAPLYLSDNALLASMLLDPSPIVETVTVTRGPPWYLWAGVATLAAGGAAGIAIAVAGGDDTGEGNGNGNGDEPEDPNQGVIIVGPF